MSEKRVSFGSDNHAGVHPRVFEKILEADALGDVPAYGSDSVTSEALTLFKREFGEKSETFFVFNGSAANTLALSAFVPSYGSVLCAEKAHITVDESGAPEKFGGFKLDHVPTPDQKVRLPELEKKFSRVGDQHANQPRALSISQTTEYGTLYTIAELKELSAFCKKRRLAFHMDGARIANAAASLGVSFREMTVDCGVDVLSFGGTKNGLLGAEAIVFMDGARAREFQWVRKQGLQLASKMRFLSAQFIAYFDGELWKKNALHANSMAKALASEISKIPGFKLTQKTEGNAVFAVAPHARLEKVRERFPFYVWDEEKSEVRLMTSWKTSEADLRAFIGAIQSALA